MSPLVVLTVLLSVAALVTLTDMFLLAGRTARTRLLVLKATLLTVALWRQLRLEANMLSGAQR